MRYDFKGKKKKPLPRKSRKVARNPIKAKMTVAERNRMEEMKAFNEKYPSYTSGKKLDPCLVEDDSYKEYAKSKYTVAIAYNKGSYQVIPKEDLEHIGK